MNKCIINERYIAEHQNKLNIYDLQNYEFFSEFFLTKKIRKIRILDLCHQETKGKDNARNAKKLAVVWVEAA